MLERVHNPSLQCFSSHNKNSMLYYLDFARDFQSRVARAAMNEIQEGINAPPSKPEDQRDHLGDLRAKGRLQKVSSRRIGSAKQGKV